MTTLAALTQTTLNLLYGLGFDEHPKEDTLNGAVATGATSATPTTTALWKKDDYAEIPATDEVWVFAADSAGATTIRRAQKGTSDPGSSTPTGSVMRKNPPYLQYDVKQSIREVVRGMLWPQVWTWHRDTITPASTTFTYELDQYVEKGVLLYQWNVDSDDRYRALPPGWWDAEAQTNTAVASTGNLLYIKKVWDYDETVYVLAKRRPHVDDLANVSDEIADLIPYAAAAKMVLRREGQVRQSAPRTAFDKEGGYARAHRNLMGEFYRMRDELQRLLRSEVRPDMRYRAQHRAGPRRSW